MNPFELIFNLRKLLIPKNTLQSSVNVTETDYCLKIDVKCIKKTEIKKIDISFTNCNNDIKFDDLK